MRKTKDFGVGKGCLFRPVVSKQIPMQSANSVHQEKASGCISGFYPAGRSENLYEDTWDMGREQNCSEPLCLLINGTLRKIHYFPLSQVTLKEIYKLLSRSCFLLFKFSLNI